MKRMWVVVLVRAPKTPDFPNGYFPRKLYYKADAEKLVRQIQAQDGNAYVKKEGE